MANPTPSPKAARPAVRTLEATPCPSHLAHEVQYGADRLDVALQALLIEVYEGRVEDPDVLELALEGLRKRCEDLQESVAQLFPQPRLRAEASAHARLGRLVNL